MCIHVSSQFMRLHNSHESYNIINELFIIKLKRNETVFPNEEPKKEMFNT